jgi:hydroxyethylthiazole kinase
MQMLKQRMENVRNSVPLVHSITNYVTVNDCANMILACGGSPIMADDIEEVKEITSLCSATVINIGTLNKRTIEAMIIAGKRANELKHPVILDPVGAGASCLRTKTVFQLLHEIDFAVIRGNISEIKTIYEGMGTTKGVDADEADEITNRNLPAVVQMAKSLSERTKAIIVITGAVDIITDGKKVYCIHNGARIMSKVTGTGCMLSGVIGAYCGANPQEQLEAVVTAVTLMGVCGELSDQKLEREESGTASFKMHFIDWVSKIEGELLEKGAKIEEYKS